MDDTPRATIDEEEARSWLADHGDALYRYALGRVRQAQLAEDLVQDTLLAAWRGRASFGNRSAIRTWLTGILRHKILDHWRRSRRWRNASDLLGPDETTDELFDRLHRWRGDAQPQQWDPVATSERGDLRAALSACMDRLPTRLRQLFVLAEVEEEDRVELAARFGFTPNHLAVLLYRARQRLRLCLDGKLPHRAGR